MELRAYLEVLRRRRWLVVSVTVLVALVAGVTSLMRTSVYRADARVLLRPNDPTEQLQSEGRDVADADRYLSAQLDIIMSEAVAREAAKEVPGSSVDLLLAQVSASQSGTTDIVRISATDRDPVMATKVANAFAKAYFENRRQFAVEGLERAGKELNTKLAELQSRIGELDGRIARQDPAAAAAIASAPRKRRAAADVSGTAPPADIPAGDGALEDIGPMASIEALKAARYAATVQYETLYARQQELLIEKSLKRGEAELISGAKLPRAPISPRPKRAAAMGGLLGLLLGLGIAFLREQLDERLRTREEAETATGLLVLAELPFDEDSAREPDGVASHLRPSGALAEATRGLRTSLSFLGVDEPLRRVVVTSGGSGEGKSLVAANLATVYAQAGMRTILVSADLRRPRLDTMFSVPAGAAGLTDVIAGLSEGRPSTNGTQTLFHTGLEVALTSALLPTSVDGLFLLPAGKLPPNPAELLGSQRAGEVCDALSALADVVVIDTPPVLAVTDAAVLAPRADAVVLVASAGQTHKGGLARSAGTLAATRTRVLGLVFNKVDNNSGSGYGYGRYYRAYYGPIEPRRRPRLPWKRAGKPAAEAER
jgi:succinoglycan biosynthesis transport protein ExoP